MSQGFAGTAAIESVAQTDTLSSYEFWLDRQRSSILQSEIRLMIAVLEDALKCYFDYAGGKTRLESKLFNEAEQWFFSEDDEELFSFKSICAFLNMDPDYVRKGLLSFKMGSRRDGKMKNDFQQALELGSNANKKS